MTRPSLARTITALNQAQARPDLPARAGAVEQLLPDIRALIADGLRAQEASKLLAKAARALDPHAPLLRDPAEAIGQVEALLAMATLDERRGRGRPSIGPATEVTLYPHTYAWLDQLGRDLGITKRATVIRHVVEQAQQAAQLHQPGQDRAER